MPYRAISKDLKERSLFLSDYPDLVHSVEDVLGVSRASIYRWKANFDKYGSVEPPQSKKVGRPSILDSDSQEQLRQLWRGDWLASSCNLT
jgi:transposase